MKLIRAIIRPESTTRVVEALERAGITAMTRVAVTGRGKELGITAGNIRYTEIPKEMLIIEVADSLVQTAVSVITKAARTGATDHPVCGTIGDGKVFITEIIESYRISNGLRTGNEG